MKKKIDTLSTDWEVLTHLDIDARASFAEIGRALETSKENVSNAARRLEKAGVIAKYYAVINLARLGLTPYVVYAQLKILARKERQDALIKLSKFPEIYWISSVGGKYDICFGIVAKSARQFSELLYAIEASLGDTLTRIAIHTRLQTIQFPRNYLSEKAPNRKKLSNKKVLTFGASISLRMLTKKEKAIINMISSNARISLVELSNHINVSRATAARLLRGLERENIISGYAANIKITQLGYQTYRLLIKTRSKSPRLAMRIYRYAIGQSNITYIDFGFGEWDIELTCEVLTQIELQDILASINSDFTGEIDSVELLSVFEDNVKFQFSLPALL